MKKKIWKLFAFVLAVFMTAATSSTALIYAEGETTQASPDILLFRDYEDYNGGNVFLNSSYKYGSLNIGAGGKYANALTAVNGAGGKGFRTNMAGDNSGAWDTTLANPITSGKVYIAYDVQKKSDKVQAEEGSTVRADNGIRFNKGMMDENNKESWLFYPTAFQTGEGQGIQDGAFSLSSWGKTDPVMKAGHTYHVEAIVDMDEYKVIGYVDGEKKREWSFDDKKDSVINEEKFAIRKVGVQFGSGIEYFDNLAIIHYPTGTSDSGTIDVSASGYDKTDNSLVINLKRNVLCTDTIDDTEYNHSASYGESVSAESLKNIVTVKDDSGATCNVTSVSNGDISGEYKIKLGEELGEKRTYTVTLNNPENTDETVKSILGTPVSTTANTANIYIIPEVYFDYDFENGETGWTNDLDSDAGAQSAKVAYDDRYGYFVYVSDNKTTKVFFKEIGEPINSGVKNISFDYKFKKSVDGEVVTKYPNKPDYISFYNSANTRKWLFYADYSGDAPKFMLGQNKVNGYGDKNKVKEVENDKLYHVDIVMDYDNLKYTGYVNGEKFAESTLSASGNEIKRMLLNQFQTAFFDNYRLSDMNDTSFKIDSTTKRNSLYEIKLSEGLSSASAAAITKDTLAVKNVSTGESVAVKSVEAIGRRVIFDFDNELDPGSDYEITLPENLTNVIGKTLSDRKAVIEGKNLKVEKIEMKKADGTVITDAAQISDGETIKLCVTYKNTSDSVKPFKLLGAAFTEYGLSDDIMINVEAAANMDASTVAEYEFKLENGADAIRLGCYAWDAMETIKPLIKNAAVSVNSAE